MYQIKHILVCLSLLSSVLTMPQSSREKEAEKESKYLSDKEILEESSAQSSNNSRELDLPRMKRQYEGEPYESRHTEVYIKIGGFLPRLRHYFYVTTEYLRTIFRYLSLLVPRVVIKIF